MEALAIGSALRRYAAYRKRGSVRKRQRNGLHEDCNQARKCSQCSGKKREEEVAHEREGQGRVQGAKKSDDGEDCECECECEGRVSVSVSVRGAGAQEALARQTEAIIWGDGAELSGALALGRCCTLGDWFH